MATPSHSRVEVRSEADAVTLTNAALDAIDLLEPILVDETRLLSEGSTREALALTPAKEDAARGYITTIEAVKHNTIALQRFRPDAIEMIKERHQGFNQVMERNMAVLATARSVSESIIREVSAEVARASQPAGYGPGMRPSNAGAKTPASAPLAVSKKV
jgi:hypothetical protein